MSFPDESYNLRIELDTKHCELSGGAIEKMEADLQPLRRVVRDFPVSDLYLTIIRHPRSQDYHVKTALRLPKKTLFTGDRDREIHPAYERCIRKLVNKVEHYKRALSGQFEYEKKAQGTRQEVLPTQPPDVSAIDRAARDQDYSAFYRAMSVYEEPVRKRIGRWIKRYPRAEAELGKTLTLAELGEEVILNAFERYEQRPAVPLGEWLEGLIDDSVRAFLEDPEAERENVRFAETLRESATREAEGKSSP